MKRNLLLLLFIIAVILPAFSQRILKDIAQGTDNAYIFQGGSFTSGDTLFFRANEAKEGRYAYFITNGQPGSVKKISDNTFGSRDLGYEPMHYKFQNTMYFAFEGNIFKSQNDATFLIKSIYSGYRHQFLGFFQINDHLYFLIYDHSAGTFEYWETDGTSWGTTLQKRITVQNSSGSLGEGFYFDNKYYFSFNDSDSFYGIGTNFFVTDGTINGTNIFKNYRVNFLDNMPFGNYFYSTAPETGDVEWRKKLWKSKGDSLSSQLVLPQVDGNSDYIAYNPFVLKDNLYFTSYVNFQTKISKFDTLTSTVTHITGNINLHGELTITDKKIFYCAYNNNNTAIDFYENSGSLESNKLLFSIPWEYYDDFWFLNGNTKHYAVQRKVRGSPDLSVVGDVIYWVFDGNNLKKITDLHPEIALGSLVNVRKVINDVFYFGAADSSHGYELWRTDGTVDGTFLLKDINTQIASSNAQLQFGLGDYVYFMADDIRHGSEPWRTNGTSTSLLVDFNGNSSLNPVMESTHISHTKFKNSYIVNLSTKYIQIKQNGEIKQLNNVPIFSASTPHQFKDSLFFMGNDGNLWKTDETFLNPKKAVHLDSTNNWAENYGINELNHIDETLFFVTNYNSELWKTNGQKSGTMRLFKGETDELPQTNFFGQHYWVIDKKLFFERINKIEQKTELWVTDGTIPGTIKFLTSQFYSTIGVYNNKFYFMHNQTLWCSDGTIAGTVKIDNREFVSGMQLRDKFYLIRNTGNTIEYYELNTNNNLILITTVSSFVAETGSYASNFYNIDDRYLLNYFSTPTYQHFYLTDGTKENTKKAFVLKNSKPYRYNIDYTFLYHNKKIYFSAVDSLKGQELWIWDFECPDGYTVRDSITTDSTIVYGKNIWGQNIVGNNKTVTYDAKNSITLQPGFEAQRGTVFKTKLIGCANNNTPNSIEGDSPSKIEPLVKVKSSTTYPQLIDFLYYLPNKHLKEIYEQALRTKLAPVSWDIVTEKDIYRLELKIGSSVLKGFLPKKK